jgi:hypothetical protein
MQGEIEKTRIAKQQVQDKHPGDHEGQETNANENSHFENA